MGDVVKIKTDGSPEQADLAIGIRKDENENVIVNFGKEIAWFGLPAPKAVEFAMQILAVIGAKVQLQYPDEFFEALLEAARTLDRASALAKVKALLNG